MTPAIPARTRLAAPARRTRPAPAAPALVAVLVATLAGAAGLAHAAGSLYRWSEPDGSLTYSPTAPTDGTAYVAVDPMTMQPVGADAPVADRGISRASGASPERAAGTPAIVASARPAPAAQAPSTFTDPAPLVRAERNRSPDLGAAATRPSANTAPWAGIERSTTYGGMSEKERRCGELEKRVISLERRLSSPLTPEAMDDTVVQMARYQQNVDRHCR